MISLSQGDTKMLFTQHMQQRMQQRNFDPSIIEVILKTGEWNQRGDQLTVNSDSIELIEQSIYEIRRNIKKQNQLLKILERTKKRKQSTLVLKDNALITVYQKAKV